MNTVLWIAQILLGLLFLMAGAMKATQPKEKLAERGLTWVEDFGQNTIRMIGIVEVLGAIGLILPMLLDILPVLTPLAAAGLALTMVGAAVVHFRRNEYPGIGINVVLFALSLFVVYGRLVALPVA